MYIKLTIKYSSKNEYNPILNPDSKYKTIGGNSDIIAIPNTMALLFFVPNTSIIFVILFDIIIDIIIICMNIIPAGNGIVSIHKI